MRQCAVFFISLLTVFLTNAALAKTARDIKPDWKYVETRLKKEGFKSAFIKDLKANYDSDSIKEVLELNTLLFLKKSDYHGIQVTDEAATTVRGFIEMNQDALEAAEKKYGVRKEIVASLLWMESRHGKNLGQFHVASVFVDLLQADRPANVLYLHEAAKKFAPHVTNKNRRDISVRTKRRVNWAIAELKAIQKMRAENPNVVRDLRGSFAGAFGMAQFEPSSYVAYAKSLTPGHPANLESADDAIQSVAYYLHKNGWKKNKPKSFVQALLRYNNSHDYANAIIKLAGQAAPQSAESKRTPAAKSRTHSTRPKM